MTLDWDRSEWIWLVPVQWKFGHQSGTNSPFCPSFVLSNAATPAAYYNVSLPARHAVALHNRDSIQCMQLLSCWRLSKVNCFNNVAGHSAVSPPEIEQWTPVVDAGLVNGRAKVKYQRREHPGTEGEFDIQPEQLETERAQMYDAVRCVKSAVQSEPSNIYDFSEPRVSNVIPAGISRGRRILRILTH